MKSPRARNPGEATTIGAVLLHIDAAYDLVIEYRALNLTVYKRNPILKKPALKSTLNENPG
ncbi:hypothetical protein [Caballeronia sp. dw_276]|uniref:hypothetical protein n=1 Tax=Caballeronia sp. dw_276 TaxID=2719795 RepID=UPI001BD3B5B6|nr:hypothetical protein [Caballeronia sp. dw_276]